MVIDENNGTENELNDIDGGSVDAAGGDIDLVDVNMDNGWTNAHVMNGDMDETLIDAENPGDGGCDPLNIKIEGQPIDTINPDYAEDLSLDAQCDVFDDEVVMFYDSLSAFKPIISQMEIKRNDVFSGTMPYKEYVSCYYILHTCCSRLTFYRHIFVDYIFFSYHN